MNIVSNEKEISAHEIGSFEIKSGKIRFSDPCYTNDTWCAGSKDAENGIYQAKVGMFQDEYDLHIKNKDLNRIKFLQDIYLNFEKYKHLNLNELLLSFKHCKTKEIPDKFKSLYNDALSYFKEKYNEIHDSHYEINEYCKSEISNILYSLDFKLQTYISLYYDAETKEEQKTRMFQLIIESIENQLTNTDDVHKRVMYLHIKHDSLSDFTSFDSNDWIYNYDFNVGVDSGQAGFFDHKFFENYSSMSEEDRDKIYSDMCSLSSDGTSYRNSNNKSKLDGGSFELGCVSHTAYGDGSAPLFCRYNNDNKVIEAVYHYTSNEDEEE